MSSDPPRIKEFILQLGTPKQGPIFFPNVLGSFNVPLPAELLTCGATHIRLRKMEAFCTDSNGGIHGNGSNSKVDLQVNFPCATALVVDTTCAAGLSPRHVSWRCTNTFTQVGSGGWTTIADVSAWRKLSGPLPNTLNAQLSVVSGWIFNDSASSAETNYWVFFFELLLPDAQTW